jgi:hypothetical protein
LLDPDVATVALTDELGVGRMYCEDYMKKLKAVKELKVQRPPRATVSEKEALERMADFPKRKAQFLATARTGKSRNLPS